MSVAVVGRAGVGCGIFDSLRLVDFAHNYQRWQ